VLGTATRSVVGGLGVALVGRELNNSWLEADLTTAVSAQGATCPPAVCSTVANPFIRRNVYELSDGEIASLRRGVAVMKQRTPADPTSWIFQANLHAVPALPEENLWCQHWSWFFLPWHRMYLYLFERILRDASGDPTLTLPYWNYSDVLEQRVLPRALGDEFDAAGIPNPLFEVRRAPGINDGSVPLTEETIQYLPSLQNYTRFEALSDTEISFGGRRIMDPDSRGPIAGSVEGTPHGGVHNEVGGLTGIFEHTFDTAGDFEYRCSLHPTETGKIEVRAGAPEPEEAIVRIANPDSESESVFDPPVLTVPVGAAVLWGNLDLDNPHSVTALNDTFDSGLLEPPGLMGDPRLAARDPTFWLHHANIDRLWNRWLDRGEGRANPITDCEWMDEEFPFYDESGAKVLMSAKQVLDMVNCLGYRYDDDPIVAPVEGAAIAAVATPVAVAAPEVAQLGESSPDLTITLGVEQVTVPIPLAAPAEAALSDITVSAATPVAGALAPYVVLSLEGIRDRGAPGITYGVYVNLPPGVEPDPKSEYFVGTVYTFGLRHAGGHQMTGQEARQNFNITRAVRTAQERGEWQGEVTVTFVPLGLAVEAATAAPGMAAATAFPSAPQGPWVSIDRITMSGIN
jgi:plastocyanin